MSHIPAKAMPHARSHEDAHTDSGTFAPPLSKRQEPGRDVASADRTAGPSLTALAFGGVLALGVIAAIALPSLLGSKSKVEPKKGKRRKAA